MPKTNTQVNKRKIKVIHFRDKCIGCGACTLLDPKNWEINEEGKANLKNSICKKNFYIGEIDQEDYEINIDVETCCPTNIIRIEDK